FMGRLQLLTRAPALALPAQPLTVQQVRASELGTQLGTAKPIDRLAIQVLGGGTVAEQRPAPCLDAERDLSAARQRLRPQPLERIAGRPAVSGAGGRLH